MQYFQDGKKLSERLNEFGRNYRRFSIYLEGIIPPDILITELKVDGLEKYCEKIICRGKPNYATLRDLTFEFTEKIERGELTEEDKKIAEKTAIAIVEKKIIPLRKELEKKEKENANEEELLKIFYEICGYVDAVQSLTKDNYKKWGKKKIQDKKVDDGKRFLDFVKKIRQ